MLPRAPRLPATVTKMHTCAIERPIEHLKHLARAPVTHRIHSCVFTSSPYFSRLCTKKCPSGVTDQRVFDSTFIHCLNLIMSFFPKELQGYCILLYHTIWGKVLLNRRTNVFALFCGSMAYQRQDVHDCSTMN